MAISYEQMPAANQQKALDIFGRQLRGEISQAQAEREARANEADAQKKVSSAATATTPPPSSSTGGGSTGGGSTGGGSSNRSGGGGGGGSSVCGPKPTSSAGAGYTWKCDSNSGRWVRVKVGGESTTNYRPGQNVGGPDRVTPDGGAVVEGIYIAPGTFGPGANLLPDSDVEDEEVPKTIMPVDGGAGADEQPAEEIDPMRDPTRIPDDAPDGYTYEWNGTRWVLRRDADVASDFATQQARESAMDVISRRLETYGLGSLANFVWNLITQENITSEYALIERIRETDQYKQRFPAMKMRRDRNLNAISEQDYINLENSYRETMQIAGMPRGLFDGPEDFTSLITGDVSPKELQQRVQAGYQAVAQSNPQVINEMKRLYGVEDSMLAAYFLDPEKATPMLLRQAQSAQIAAEATLQAEMGITAGTAEELAVAGVTQEQARAGFQAIQAGQELFVPLPGTTEAAIAQEEQIAGVFGTSAAAQQRIRQRTRERQATFEAGGRFAGQGTTVTGLQ